MTSVRARVDQAVRMPSVWFLVLSNVIPLFGTLFLGWNVGLILLIYWVETVIIGLINLPKLLTALGSPNPGLFGRLFFCAFFTVHYGMFNFGHYVFLTEMFDLPPITEQTRNYALLTAVSGLLLSHLFSMIANWFGRGEFRKTPVGEQMFLPYGRIVVMHMVIIAGGFAVEALGQPLIALILLVVIKTIIDLFSHKVSHEKTLITQRSLS